MSKEKIKKIRRELKPLANFEAVIYGSMVTGENTPRSDIDIAVITRKRETEKNIETYYKLLEWNRKPYDIKIFELLPLHLKAQIFKNYIVLFGDVLEISEYFYYWWKEWRDMEKRYLENQLENVQERIEKLKERAKPG